MARTVKLLGTDAIRYVHLRDLRDKQLKAKHPQQRLPVEDRYGNTSYEVVPDGWTDELLIEALEKANGGNYRKTGKRITPNKK